MVTGHDLSKMTDKWLMYSVYISETT